MCICMSKPFNEKINLLLFVQYESEHVMRMGWSPRCYIPSFVKIGLPVLEKKSFEGFLPFMGVAAILVM